MSKGPYLTPKVKRMLLEIYVADRQIKPSKARELLLERMKAKGLNEIFGSDYPHGSTVSNQLKLLREKDEGRLPESKELDEPWHLSSLPKYPIPPEALPLIMRVYTKNMCEAAMPAWNLSMREALWIGRLYRILELYSHEQMADWTNPDNTENVTASIRLGHLPENYQEISFEDIVLDWAYAMASEEEYRELADDPSGFEDIGSRIIGNIFGYYGERRRDFIDDMAEEYGIDDDKFQELESMPMADVNQFFITLEIERGRAKRKPVQEEGGKNERKHKRGKDERRHKKTK